VNECHISNLIIVYILYSSARIRFRWHEALSGKDEQLGFPKVLALHPLPVLLPHLLCKLRCLPCMGNPWASTGAQYNGLRQMGMAGRVLERTDSQFPDGRYTFLLLRFLGLHFLPNLPELLLPPLCLFLQVLQ